MAYQALYNKYRPQTFDEVVGQKSIVTTLKNAIREDKIAHAYLFCGPRGTGKTTMARLFAKALDCKEGIGHQCLNCDSCKAIAAGEHPDVIEIDAASNSSVDSVRQLIDNVSYQPIMSPYKVYIIDEVHNMSTPAFNALLKTLEEPPSFVVFILCTTDPQKIIPTILSRVQRFNFAKVLPQDLVENMKRVLKNEHVDYDEDALEAVASLSDGGVRDSLSLLDQLVSYADRKITLQDVDNLFGLLSLKDELQLVERIEKRETGACLTTVREKYNQGMNVLRLHDDLLELFKDLLIFKTTNDESLLSKTKKADIENLLLPATVLRHDIDILLEGRRNYRYADSLLSNLELTLMTLTAKGETFAPNAVQTAPSPSPASTMVAPKESKDETLASKPVEITTSSKKGFQSKGAETKKVEETKKVVHTSRDVLNLMNQADKNERLATVAKWESLASYLSTPQAYLAKALSACKLRLVALNVLVVTTPVLADLAILTEMEEQKNIRRLTKEAFGKEYDILTITNEEYKEDLVLFRSQGDDKVKEKCQIDFGKQSDESASTAFFNSLMQD